MEEVTRETILYLRDVLGLSFYQIEQRTGVSRKLASSLYRRGQRRRVKRPFLLDPYRSVIAEWFKPYPKLKAKQVHRWLKERG